MLFKLAAKDSIDRIQYDSSDSDSSSDDRESMVTDEQLQKCSIKYQVLAKNTCFVGVKSQKKKFNDPSSKTKISLS